VGPSCRQSVADRIGGYSRGYLAAARTGGNSARG
jgi:hypothetical protein